MKELPKKYNHKETEKSWQTYWNDKNTYAWDESESRENTFVIDTPPPTVSGILHMGHIFSYTQADFVARYQRMAGKTVFYPMGFDDNGLPTERLVEKAIKKRATDMSREEFIGECEKVSEAARREYRHLFESTALSVDWAQEYHTISEESRRISQMSFLDLHGKELTYRKLQPMLWDPIDQTAIAQAEIEDKEMDGFFNDIIFEVTNSDGTALSKEEFGGRKLSPDSDDEAIIWRNERSYVVIGTTRPELIPACVAVFFNAEDNRYKGLQNKEAITPLFGVKVPILEDDTVEIDKGTGIMMCCTFGDEADIDKWQRHDLPARIILNKYGKIEFSVMEDGKPDWNNDIAETLSSLKAKVAREKILELLKENNLLVKQEAITHAVKCAERSGAPLEILPTQQWFVKILDKKDELKAKVNECNWNPDYMRLRCEQWIDGLNWDWCISRQRYFGVPFPAWYSKRSGEEGRILVASASQLPVNPLVDLPEGYARDEVEAEADVMDTWATSSVSPQLSSKGISEEYAVDSNRHQKLFPADLRPQAHEIIRTWAFYTIVKAHLHEDEIPWQNLMISGWCLASDKTKMSKSKGNVVTPVDLIEDKGADVVRYWSSTSKLGTDTAFSEDVLKIGKKLVTKLWNASKFATIQLDVLSTTSQQPTTAKQDIDENIITETLDKWIITRLHRAIEKASKEFERFEYCNARAAVEDFFWNDFCDNYLEMAKTRAYGNQNSKQIAGLANPDSPEPGAAGSSCASKQANAEELDNLPQLSAAFTIYHCLETILRLFAPIVPHITDELYSHIFDDRHQQIGSIHARGTWPQAIDYPVDENAEQIGIAARQILDVVRKMKAEKNVSLRWPLGELVIASNNGASTDISSCFSDLKNVTNAKVITLANELSSGGSLSEDGTWNIGVTFASNSDAA